MGYTQFVETLQVGLFTSSINGLNDANESNQLTSTIPQSCYPSRKKSKVWNRKNIWDKGNTKEFTVFDEICFYVTIFIRNCKLV
jgi:hypothetical protein